MKQDKLKKLIDIGIALSSERNIDNLLKLIVREARGFTNADAGSLYICQDDLLAFVVAQNDTIAKRTHGKSEFKTFSIPIDRKSIAGYVAATGETLIIDDVYKLSDDKPYGFNKDFDNQNDYRTKSMCIVPMRDSDDNIIGVLQLINFQDKNNNIISFKHSDRDIVLSLASQAAIALVNVGLLKRLENLFEAMIKYSAEAIDARDPTTAGHTRRVVQYSVNLAKALNKFSKNELKNIEYAAWLHDIGKIGIREYILNKANKLTDKDIEIIKYRIDNIILNYRLKCSESKISQEEFNNIKKELLDIFVFIENLNKINFLSNENKERLDKIYKSEYYDCDNNCIKILNKYEYFNLSIKKGTLNENELKHMQSHVIKTEEILSKLPWEQGMETIPAIAASHHEKLNGTGYYKGLAGDEIPLESQIIAIADIYDALTAQDRPYKPAMPVEKALKILSFEVKDEHLNAELVDIFVKEKIYESVKQ